MFSIRNANNYYLYTSKTLVLVIRGKVVHYSKTKGRPQLDSSFKDGSKLQHLGKSDLYLKSSKHIHRYLIAVWALGLQMGLHLWPFAACCSYMITICYSSPPPSNFWQNSSHWGRWILLYDCSKIVVKVSSTWLKTVII